MFEETLLLLTRAASSKVDRLKTSRMAYIILSMMGGAYVGFAILLTYTIGGLFALEQSALGPLVMGLAFGVALSLVLFAGSELFTGNTMIMAVAVRRKTASLVELLQVWCCCYLGNLLGAMLLGFIFYHTGFTEGATGDFFIKAASAKMSAPWLHLVMRGILCNVLVCLAVWTFYRMKSESGKLIMVFWTLFAFITSGFEHSVANMTVHSVVLLMGKHPEVINLGSAIYNLFFATLGNILGGVFLVGLAYDFVAKKEG